MLCQLRIRLFNVNGHPHIRQHKQNLGAVGQGLGLFLSPGPGGNMSGDGAGRGILSLNRDIAVDGLGIQQQIRSQLTRHRHGVFSLGGQIITGIADEDATTCHQ
jgi:hypothetical protein